MRDQGGARPEGFWGSLIVSAVFLLAGVVAIYDSLSYTDRDSQVFPQTVAVVLIVTSGVSILWQFLRPTPSEGFGSGIWWRRVLLVAGMFATCLAMPVVGFLPAGALAFGGGLIAAMHDRWGAVNVVLYWGSGAVIMGTFYALFKFVLLVPLP